MFDGVDSGANGALRPGGSMGVGGGLAAQRVRLIHQRVQLGLGQLRRIDIVGERENAAGGAGLDHVGAILDVESHRLARLVGAVDYALLNAGLPPEDAEREAAPSVAVSAGSAQGVNGYQHARPGDHARIDGVAQATSM